MPPDDVILAKVEIIERSAPLKHGSKQFSMRQILNQGFALGQQYQQVPG